MRTGVPTGFTPGLANWSGDTGFTSRISKFLFEIASCEDEARCSFAA